MYYLDDFVSADRPLRVIRVMVNKALANMDDLFGQMYAADIKGCRPQHCARETAACHVDTGALQRTLRAPAYGADPGQPAVSLVHRTGHG